MFLKESKWIIISKRVLLAILLYMGSKIKLESLIEILPVRLNVINCSKKLIFCHINKFNEPLKCKHFIMQIVSILSTHLSSHKNVIGPCYQLCQQSLNSLKEEIRLTARSGDRKSSRLPSIARLSQAYRKLCNTYSERCLPQYYHV